MLSPARTLTSAPWDGPDAAKLRPARIDTLPAAPDALSPLANVKDPDAPAHAEPLLTSTVPLVTTDEEAIVPR